MNSGITNISITVILICMGVSAVHMSGSIPAAMVPPILMGVTFLVGGCMADVLIGALATRRVHVSNAGFAIAILIVASGTVKAVSVLTSYTQFKTGAFAKIIEEKKDSTGGRLRESLQVQHVHAVNEMTRLSNAGKAGSAEYQAAKQDASNIFAQMSAIPPESASELAEGVTAAEQRESITRRQLGYAFLLDIIPWALGIGLGCWQGGRDTEDREGEAMPFDLPDPPPRGKPLTGRKTGVGISGLTAALRLPALSGIERQARIDRKANQAFKAKRSAYRQQTSTAKTTPSAKRSVVRSGGKPTRKFHRLLGKARDYVATLEPDTHVTNKSLVGISSSSDTRAKLLQSLINEGMLMKDGRGRATKKRAVQEAVAA